MDERRMSDLTHNYFLSSIGQYNICKLSKYPEKEKDDQLNKCGSDDQSSGKEEKYFGLRTGRTESALFRITVLQQPTDNLSLGAYIFLKSHQRSQFLDIMATSMAAAIAASIPASQAGPAPVQTTYEAIPPSMSKVIDIEGEIPINTVQLDALVSEHLSQRNDLLNNAKTLILRLFPKSLNTVLNHPTQLGC